MSPFHLFEICIYELVDLIPNLLLALLPFRDSMRFPKKATALFISLVYILMVCSRVLALGNLPAAAALTVLWIAVYLAFYVFTVKAQVSKILFVLLTILNYCSFIAVVFSYFAYHRFPAATSHPYSLYASAILVTVYLVSYPLIYVMLYNKMRNLVIFSKITDTGNSYGWFPQPSALPIIIISTQTAVSSCFPQN